MATSQPLGYAVEYAVTSLAALGVAFYYSWSLTLVTLATVPLSAIILSVISARLQPSIKAQEAELTKASKIVNNTIASIDTVKGFNGQDYEKWQYAGAVKRAAKHYLVEAQANAQQIGFVRLVILGMFVQGFWYGSHLVNTGLKNPGDILTCFWACLMAAQSIEQILPQIIVLEKGKAAGATLKANIVNMERGRTIVSMLGGNSPPHCEGDIEVRNVGTSNPNSDCADRYQVTFYYPSRPDKPALRNVNFFFAAGDTTFVVGKSGSGKSTLGNLLLRFYTPKSGEVIVDTHSVQTLHLDWLRNNITLVQQQSVLFNETVFKNISFGRKDHSTVRKEEVKKAIKTALLQHTIMELPQGLDTVVGVGGNALSGGQKQRVAIARSRLRDTPILILDEATSALDHVNRGLVIEAIREWRKGKTTIIVTHDMSQVQDDDYAYVLEDGVVTQEGFRRTLEKTELGPFKEKRDTVVAIPKAARRHRDAPLYRPHYPPSSQSRVVSPFTTLLEDSTDFQSSPKRKRAPSFFRTPSAVARNRRVSQYGFASPLSPSAFKLVPGASYFSTLMTSAQKELPALPTLDLVDPVGAQSLKDIGMTSVGAKAADNQPTTLHQEYSPPARVHLQELRPSLTVSTVSAVMEQERRRQSNKAGKEHVAPLKKILLTIWPTLTWKDRMILLIGFLSAAIHAAATPTFSYVFAKLLSTFYLTDPSQRSRQAQDWSLSVLAVAFVDSVASYLMHYLLERCGQAWIDSLRVEALKRILDQPRSWFEKDNNSLTHLTECLDRNAEEMRNLLGRFAGFAFVAVIMASMAVIWSLVISWRLTLVGLASGPFIYASTRVYETISGRWENRSDEAASNANAIFAETFGNIRTVRALTLENYFHRKYSRAVKQALYTGLKRSAYSGFFFGLSDSGIVFVTALIFWYGATLVSSHAYSTQDILTVFTMLLFSIANANAIVAYIPQINSSRSTATRLLRLAHLPYKASHEHTGQIRIHRPGTITFNNVTFTYPSRPTIPILSSLNLTLMPGTSTALVGSSGSGKSTIANLLLALYPPSSGELTINKFPISELHIPTLRILIASVPQQPTLFPTTIAQNIAYALPESSHLASIPNVRAAAKAAGIHDFIRSLPLGYETLIGEGGSGLSGGQAQRIAIARAIVRRPRLLILDEATSGLDQETAKGIRDMVGLLQRQGVAVIAITHDKEMMKVCSDVVVLKDGKVAERGAYGELRGAGGELTRLLGNERVVVDI